MRVVVLITLLMSSLAFADDPSEVREFFDRYVELGKNFDTDLVALYSDDAKISTLRDGRDSLEFTGAEWKALVGKLMPLAERRGDVSTYTDVQVEPHGEGYRITALRASALKCTDNHDHYMDVERQGGRWVIVEEYMETVSLSQCEPSEELAETLSNISDMIRPHLPMDLDTDTRLESVEVEGTALVYRQRVHTLAASVNDWGQIDLMLISSACLYGPLARANRANRPTIIGVRSI